MRKTIKLSVNKACHENWSSFDKNETGGFCSRCQKDVIDFTGKSENEIFHFFSREVRGVCGRFRPHQLKIYNDGHEKSRLNKSAIITAGVLALAPLNESVAQETKAVPPVERTILKIDADAGIRTTLAMPVTAMHIIKGHVSSIDDKSDLPGVNVVVKGTSIGAITDANGQFQFIYDGDERKLALVFSFIGFTTVEKEIVLEETTTNVGSIKLETDVVPMLGEVCVVVYRKWSPRGIWLRIKRIFY